MNIYVGNLSYNTDDEALREEFEQFGTIESVNVIYDKFNGRSKGFGFIEMPNQAEAEAAIQELDGKEVDGRNLKVSEARPRENRGGGGHRGGGSGGGRKSFNERYDRYF